MARVIGNKPEGAWQEVCKGCHYKIEFSPADIYEGRDYDDWSRYKYVTCPKCKRTIDLLKREQESDRDDY